MNQVLETNCVRKFGLAILQCQRDARTPRLEFDVLNGELTLTVGFPADTFGRVQACPATLDDDLVSDDKCRIKADAELADQPRVLLLVARHLVEELRRAGARYGAEILDELVA